MAGPGSRRRRSSVDRLVRHFGEGFTVLLRRRHSLRDGADGVPAVLELDGAHAAGAVSVSLRLERLDGALPPGLRLSIGSQSYEVAGPGDTAAAGDRLAGVPLLAALEADFPDGEPVTVEASRDYSFLAMANLVRREELGGFTEAQASQSFVLSARGAPTIPRPDDAVLIAAGHPLEEAIFVQAIAPGAGGDGWIISPRGAAA